MDEQLRKILGRIQILKDQTILLEVDVQALLMARERIAGGNTGCVHAKAVSVTTGGGGPPRALCPECGETFTLAEEQPAQQKG